MLVVCVLTVAGAMPRALADTPPDVVFVVSGSVSSGGVVSGEVPGASLPFGDTAASFALAPQSVASVYGNSTCSGFAADGELSLTFDVKLDITPQGLNNWYSCDLKVDAYVRGCSQDYAVTWTSSGTAELQNYGCSGIFGPFGIASYNAVSYGSTYCTPTGGVSLSGDNGSKSGTSSNALVTFAKSPCAGYSLATSRTFAARAYEQGGPYLFGSRRVVVRVSGTLRVHVDLLTDGTCSSCLVAPCYDPDEWNKPPATRWNNNCLAYGANQKSDVGFAYPGASGLACPGQPNPFIKGDCKTVAPALICDGFQPSSPDGTCDCGYKVAVFCGKARGLPFSDDIWDYHVYRVGPDGRYSHKPAQGDATNLDAGSWIIPLSKGKEITDPELANKGLTGWFGPAYHGFIGYFCVTPSTRVAPKQEATSPRHSIPASGAEPIRVTTAPNTIVASPMVFSGLEDTTFTFASTSDLDSIAALLTGLDGVSDPGWGGELGYRGFMLYVDSVPALGTETVRVWNGVIRVDRDTTRSFLIDSKGLENWLVRRATQSASVGLPIPGSPREIRFGQPMPNPFARTTRIPFTLSRDAAVELRIFDLAGRVMRRLVSTDMRAGEYAIPWDGRDDLGQPLGAGTYFCRLSVGGQAVGSRRMVFLRH